jgi:hypothetical protein
MSDDGGPRRQITDALHRYCRGIDRMDADLIRAAYHDDGYDDHGDYFRGTVDEYVPWVLNLLGERFVSTMHVLSNISIEFPDGSPASDKAYVESYLIAYHVTSGTGSLRIFGARYVDKFENRPGAGWRIAHRTLVSEWQVEHAGNFVPTPPGTEPAARDRTDPSYRRD